MNDLYKTLKQFGHVKANEPLAKHTTFKIGGPAEFFVIVEETKQLVALLKYLDGEGTPHFILGGGSNMLVRDEGYAGVVIENKTRGIQIEDNSVVADSGCITVEVAQKSMQAGLTGFEWGVGVPGTIGGAVRGNAGAMGGEMKDVVKSVEVYQDGEVVSFPHVECHFRYRESVFKEIDGVVLRVTLELKPGDSKEGMKRAIEYLKYRATTQPQGHASTGCIFKNYELRDKPQPKNIDIPEEFVKKGRISAGWLVEQAGMKGVAVGKALVSERHGNFVVNTGGATAHDVLTLIEQIKARVYDRFSVELEEEIHIV